MANPKISIKVKNFGTMEAELYPEMAPKTVENFLKLVDKGFYKGLVFHRVIPDFMIQGGGLDENYETRETEAIEGEFAANGHPENCLPHARGVLSMARTSEPNSASSQFFIMHAEAPYLDGQYAAFGQLTKGLEVLDKIAAVETGSRGWYYDDAPMENVVIDNITRL